MTGVSNSGSGSINNSNNEEASNNNMNKSSRTKKNHFLSMTSLLSPSSNSTCSSYNTNNNTPNDDDDDNTIKSAANRAIQLDKRFNYLPNELAVSDDDDDDDCFVTRNNSRLFNNDDNEIDSSLYQSLPSRTPLQGLPCESDRKRIVSCLAIILASSYLYDHDDDDDDDSIQQQKHQQTPMSKQSESFIGTTPQQPIKSTATNNSKDKIRETRLRFSIQLLRQCTHLLFLDPSHAKALEPILTIRPTPTTHNYTTTPTTHNYTTTITPQKKQMKKEQPIQRSDTSLTEVSSSSSSSPLLDRHGLLLSSSHHATTESNYNSPCKMERVDTHPLEQQQHQQQQSSDMAPYSSSSSLLFCNTFTTAIGSNSEVTSPECHNYNKKYNTRHPEEEKLELLRKLREEFLPSEQQQQQHDSSTIGCDSSSSEGGMQTQQQHLILDGFRELIWPFLSQLTHPEEGYHCISLLLLHYLLTNPTGYDARVRFIFKRLATVVLVYTTDDITSTDNNNNNNNTNIEVATRKFEIMERLVSKKVLVVLAETDTQQEEEEQEQGSSTNNQNETNTCSNTTSFHRNTNTATTPGDLSSPSNRSHAAVPLTASSSTLGDFDKTQLLRTLKITTASLAAGTVFALTGGFAAPGIAAGMAAFTSSGTSLLLPHGMLTTMFGVGGGSLIGYKVQRRTKGLTQFDFKRCCNKQSSNKKENKSSLEELHTIICISGWIRDTHDFFYPWGAPTSSVVSSVTSDNKSSEEFTCYAYNLSSLIKFYDTYKPENVPRAATILQNWEGEEYELWRLLRVRYGVDPFTFVELQQQQFTNNTNNTFTFTTTTTTTSTTASNGHFCSVRLDSPEKIMEEEQFLCKHNNVLDILLEELGYNNSSAANNNNTQQQQDDSYYSSTTHVSQQHHNNISPNNNMFNVSSIPQNCNACNASGAIFGHSSSPVNITNDVNNNNNNNNKEENHSSEHTRRSWNYFSKFAGELYTVSWEENLLMELCDSVTDYALDLVEGHLVQILRQTAFHSFMNAIALPFTLVNASHMIDDTWSLTIQRTEEAGKELARSLLASQAGNRPVILMGYSMGARVIYVCLKELARHQEKWEEELKEHQTKNNDVNTNKMFPCRKTPSYSREPASIVEDAILMGCPNHISLNSWKACRRIVAGRLINCYSQKDLILSFMFQIKKMTGFRIRQVCGTRPVTIQGVENYDVTHLISQHSDYSDRIEEILDLIGYGQPSPSSLPIPLIKDEQCL